jgi:transposase
VCTRLPPARDGGRRASRVEEVPATARDVLALASRLKADQVQLVVMEATGEYWRIWYYLLESEGLNVQLVNPSHARQLAGRPKTGQLDAQWIARLAEMGLLRPSFVPPPEIRALRDLTRARLQVVRDRTREWQRLEKLLEGCLIKLSSAVHSLARTQTARAILEAIAGGERDPKALAALAMGRADRAAIEKSLDGMQVGAHHPALIRGLLDHAAFLDRRAAAIEDMIQDHLSTIEASWGTAADGTRTPDPGPGAPVLSAADRLAEIPGVSPDLARAIIAEIGLDMTRFPSAGRLASWAGLAPSPASPAPAPASPPRDTATTGSRATAPRPPSAPPARTPSSASATAASPAASAPSAPSAPSPAPSSPSSGTSSTTPNPGSPTSDPAGTPARPTATARHAATSRNSRPSATRSPSPQPPRPRHAPYQARHQHSHGP